MLNIHFAQTCWSAFFLVVILEYTVNKLDFFDWLEIYRVSKHHGTAHAGVFKCDDADWTEHRQESTIQVTLWEYISKLIWLKKVKKKWIDRFTIST